MVLQISRIMKYLHNYVKYYVLELCEIMEVTKQLLIKTGYLQQNNCVLQHNENAELYDV